MKHLVWLSLIAFLIPSSSIAQTGYHPGYAITIKGDTLKGYLEFKNWEYNPKMVSFKSEPNARPSKLTLKEISYFNIDIGYPLEFEKYEGRITADNTNVNTMLAYRDTSYKVDTVFLRILRKGKNLALFAYDDNLKTHYFIAETSQYNPVELIYRIYYDGNSTGGGNGKAIYENTYKKQLFALAIKYNKMDDKLKFDLEKSDYTEQDLTSVVSKINGVSEKDNKKGNYTANSPKIKLVLMGALFAVIAYLVFSVRHQ